MLACETDGDICLVCTELGASFASPFKALQVI